MPKFGLDYTKLENKLVKKAYHLSDVQNRLETVAFDIVRFKDADKGADLWQVQSADDGSYIVALYQEEEQEKKSSPWEVMINKTAATLQVSYKGDPIVKVASAKLGIPGTEIEQIPSYLPAKLAENKKLVRALLNQLSPASKQAVISKYPELI